MRIPKHLIPPGGWKFKQGEIWLYGETWDELVTNVITHRVSNQIRMDNPEFDIEQQLIKNNPNIKTHPFNIIIDGD